MGDSLFVYLNMVIVLTIDVPMIVWFLLQIHTWTITRWDNTTRIVAIGALYVQMVALLILWVLRAADILGHGWHSKYLFSRFNFLPSHPFPGHSSPTTGDRAGIWTTFLTFLLGHRTRMQLIFGKQIWKSPSGSRYFHRHSPAKSLQPIIRLEPHVISALRALFATSFILGILIFSVLALVIEPWSETAVVPAKSLYSTDLPADVSRMEKLPVWSIIAVSCRIIDYI